ncbi:unnamed protein product [Acanthoscelides obtectus]|uniref:Uncharacterized protein n=1 Tax=Acanthoscelides obtectus TaxID=200917 RepID=A0A9P0KK68_ACAOB|nr:unnamed protein product [Acanthoscelides obtectus]CAK1657200.1 hypothetical protein AOBTE_LOCUS20199 [Acanthoscelides obtectus]
MKSQLSALITSPEGIRASWLVSRFQPDGVDYISSEPLRLLWHRFHRHSSLMNITVDCIGISTIILNGSFVKRM